MWKLNLVKALAFCACHHENTAFLTKYGRDSAQQGEPKSAKIYHKLGSPYVACRACCGFQFEYRL